MLSDRTYIWYRDQFVMLSRIVQPLCQPQVSLKVSQNCFNLEIVYVLSTEVDRDGDGDQTLITPDLSAETIIPPTVEDDNNITSLLCSL